MTKKQVMNREKRPFIFPNLFYKILLIFLLILERNKREKARKMLLSFDFYQIDLSHVAYEAVRCGF